MGAQELTFWIRAPCGHRQRNCGLPSWNSGLRQMNCIVFVIRRRYHRDILRVSKYRYQYLNPISIAYPSCFSSIRVKSLTSHILYAFRAFLYNPGAFFHERHDFHGRKRLRQEHVLHELYYDHVSYLFRCPPCYATMSDFLHELLYLCSPVNTEDSRLVRHPRGNFHIRYLDDHSNSSSYRFRSTPSPFLQCTGEL